jgi:hypothetical protein
MSEINKIGLFVFLFSHESSRILKYFTMRRSRSLENTSLLNLFISDNSNWTSDNNKKSYFSITFSQGFAFQLEGYRIRSSDRYFPKSWILVGITENQKKIKIHTIKNETSLSSSFADKLFDVPNIPRYIGLKFIQIAENFEGTHHLSLSGVEFYGTLSKIQQSLTSSNKTE